MRLPWLLRLLASQPFCHSCVLYAVAKNLGKLDIQESRSSSRYQFLWVVLCYLTSQVSWNVLVETLVMNKPKCVLSQVWQSLLWQKQPILMVSKASMRYSILYGLEPGMSLFPSFRLDFSCFLHCAFILSSDIYLFTTNTHLRKQRGKGLAGFLKAVGYIIPLMDEEYANYYTSQIMEILLREFSSPDEEMKKVVLKVVSQCSGTDGVTAGYLKEHVLGEFFKSFWVRRMALDKRNYRQVVETTVDLGQKVGASEIVERIVGNLKDESEAYRKMTLETIEKVVASLGAADIGERLEERLIDGVLHSFQEQSVEDIVMLNGFGTVVNALGTRCKPYLPQIVSTILWRLNNKSATVRQQAADLISRIAMVMKQCGEDQLMSKLGTVLYEYLGEEYPEVLGSILGALRSIVTVVGINSMQPSIKDLLPRLTPILRNRHEKVQENTIDLVGRIADRGPESVNAREWMRICFELLDMLKAHKKGIRRAANNTFGFIAKAIGPQDVLATLLNNLRVQERQSRVCTAVAIGIVAETCAPFTVLPALMNEYRVPELNVYVKSSSDFLLKQEC